MSRPVVAIAILGVYVLVLLAIGWRARKESGDMAGYRVAGKKLPTRVIAFSSDATGESAWLLLGLTGMGYLVGIHPLWIVVGEVLGVTLAWVLVARPFKEYTDRYDAITVPDYLEERFRDRGHLLRIISAVVILSMAAVYVAARLLTRFISAGDDEEIVEGSFIAVVCIVVFDLGAVLAGMAGRALFDGLEDPGAIHPLMGMDSSPPSSPASSWWWSWRP